MVNVDVCNRDLYYKFIVSIFRIICKRGVSFGFNAYNSQLPTAIFKK
jgi:hypothetical protein